MFFRHIPYPSTAGSAHNKCQEKRPEGKNKEKTDRGRRRNHPPPTQAIDAHMGEEENRKQKQEQKKETEWIPNPTTLIIRLPLKTRMGHTAGLF